MTLCMVVRTREGLVGISDSAVNAGNVMSTKSKLAVHSLPHGTCFTLTSGLRSISDKVLSYATTSLGTSRSTRLFEVANEFGALMRRVRDEDADDLRQHRLHFDAHLLLGGRCSGDTVSTAYLIYPQGNWIEVGTEMPYLVIGQANYALPILKTLISAVTPLPQAVDAGILALDAAATSTVNVRYPIDIAVLSNRSPQVVQHRLSEAQVAPLLTHWRACQQQALASAPTLGQFSTPTL